MQQLLVLNIITVIVIFTQNTPASSEKAPFSSSLPVRKWLEKDRENINRERDKVMNGRSTKPKEKKNRKKTNDDRAQKQKV